MSNSRLVLATKQALHDASVTLFADDDVLVCWGHPGVQLPNDVFSWGRVAEVEEPGPISSSRRARDVTFQVYATISVYRPGGPDQEQVAEQRCYDLADAMSEYVRVTDTTLGGLVYWCFRTNYDSEGSTDATLLAKGRCIEATVEFTARARITS
jgi:hypothetical protein